MRTSNGRTTLSAAAGAAAVVLAVGVGQVAQLAHGTASVPAVSTRSPLVTAVTDPAALAAPVAPTPAERGVRVRGAVRQDLALSRADLAQLPQQTVTVTYTANGVPVTATFTGPLVLDVLDLAQPRFDPTVKNDQLRFAVRAIATDRYQAVVAWGEIDPGFEGKQVLLALTQDGADLIRPRLVVPGDAKGGRYVSDVVALRVFDLGT